MCDFFSAIMTRDGLLYNVNTNAHEDIVEEYGLDDTGFVPTFVRCMLFPKDKNVFNHNLDNWKFLPSAYSEEYPSWFNASVTEDLMKDAIQKVWKEIFFIGIKDEVEIRNKGLAYILDSKVRIFNVAMSYIYGQSIANLINNCNANAYDKSHVIVSSGSRVSAYGESSVLAYGHSVVNACYNSTVESRGNSCVVACDHSSIIARGDSVVVIPYSKRVRILGVYDNAIVRDGYSGKIITNTRLPIYAYDNEKKVSI